MIDISIEFSEVDVLIPKPVVWTLEQGISFARLLELAAIKGGYHVALGGGTLHKGESVKDLDIFVYPRSTELQERQAVMELFEKLVGVRWLGRRAHEYLGDDKIVEEGSWQGKRIDFFFLS